MEQIEEEAHLACHLPLVVHPLEVHLDSSLVVQQTAMVVLVEALLDSFLVHLDFSSLVELILPLQVGLVEVLEVDPMIELIAMEALKVVVVY